MKKIEPSKGKPQDVKVRGKTEKLYKPHEAAKILGYHPRTVRRFIGDGRIKAIDSNKGGKQPVWWITEAEVSRLVKSLSSLPPRNQPKKKKQAKKSR